MLYQHEPSCLSSVTHWVVQKAQSAMQEQQPQIQWLKLQLAPAAQEQKIDVRLSQA